MEFSKVKSFAHIVPNEINQHHFIPDSFQQHSVEPSSDGNTCELHLKGTNDIKQKWDLTHCIDTNTSEEPVYISDLKNLAELAIKGYDVACLNITVQTGSTATIYNQRRSNLHYLIDTLTELSSNEQTIEFAFLAVTDSQCFDMRKQINRSNDRIITRGMDSILKQVKDTSEIWRTVQDGCRDPFILTIRVTDTTKKMQGRLQYFDLLSPRFISTRLTSQPDVIESSFQYLCHFVKSMNSHDQVFDADLYVLTKELAKYLIGSNKLIVLGFVHDSIINEIQLNETIALLDFIASLKDIPTRMSRNKTIDEVEEFRKLKTDYQQLQKEHESKLKKLNDMESKKADAIAVVDNMIAETVELKAQNETLEKLAKAAALSAKCLRLQQDATKEVHEYELKQFEPERIVHYVESDIKNSCIKELNLKIVELELDIQEANTKVFSLQDKLLDVQDSRKADVNVLKKSSSAIQESNERIKELEAQVQNLQDEKDFAQTQLRVIRQKIKEYAIQLETAENDRSDFEIELRTTKDKLKKMKRGQGMDATKEQGELEHQLDLARAETQRWMDKYYKADEEYNKALADLPVELNKLKQEYEEREEKLKSEHKQKITDIKQKANANIHAARQEFDRLLAMQKTGVAVPEEETVEQDTSTPGKRKRTIEREEEEKPPVMGRSKAMKITKKDKVNEKENEHPSSSATKSVTPKKKMGRPKKRQAIEEEDAEKKHKAAEAEEMIGQEDMIAVKKEKIASEKKKSELEDNGYQAEMIDYEAAEVDIEGIDDDIDSPAFDEIPTQTETSPIHNLRTRAISNTPTAATAAAATKSPISLSKSKSLKNKKNAKSTNTKVEEEELPEATTEKPSEQEEREDEEAALRSPILGATPVVVSPEHLKLPPKRTKTVKAAAAAAARASKKDTQQQKESQTNSSQQQSSQTSTTGTRKKRRLRNTSQSKTAVEHVNDASITRSPMTWINSQKI